MHGLIIKKIHCIQKEFSMKLADKIAEFIGSWTFIVIQSTILTIWVILNVTGVLHFDQYPFILLNLFLPTFYF